MMDCPVFNGASQTTSESVELITFQWTLRHWADTFEIASLGAKAKTVSSAPVGVTASNSSAVAGLGCSDKLGDSHLV